MGEAPGGTASLDGAASVDALAGLDALEAEVVACRRCPRLVEWRERMAREKVARFRDEPYWGRPVPGFGDPAARILVVGLAPAAHGGNRTGRIFTGDRSGDFLYRALFEAGLSSSPTSVRRDDGLVLTGVRVSAVVHCAPPANKPTVDERDACLPFLGREVALLPDVRVILALGAFAWDGVLRALAGSGHAGPAATPQVRPRRGGAGRAVRAPRLVPPEPAEHVHRPADRGDAGRDRGSGAGPGRPRVVSIDPSVIRRAVLLLSMFAIASGIAAAGRASSSGDRQRRLAHLTSRC